MKNEMKIFLFMAFCIKTLICAKHLRIRFDRVDGFIDLFRDYDKTKSLVLFGREKYDAIFDRIRYFIGLKSGITYVGSHNDAKSKLIQLIICVY